MPDYQHFFSIVWWYIQYCHYFSMPVFLLKEKKDFHISHVLSKCMQLTLCGSITDYSHVLSTAHEITVKLLCPVHV